MSQGRLPESLAIITMHVEVQAIKVYIYTHIYNEVKVVNLSFGFSPEVCTHNDPSAVPS